MMAVGTSLSDAEDFCNLETFKDRIVVDANNSSSSITLSGDESAIDEAVEIFKDEGVFARKLKVDKAYHSFHMRPCSGPYIKSVSAFENGEVASSGNPRWFSSVRNGSEITLDTLSAEYWADNMLFSVMFADAVSTAISTAGPYDLALEIGPHPALQGPALDNFEEHLSSGRPPYIGLLSRGKNDVDMISTALGEIWSVFGPGSVDFKSYRQALTGEIPGLQLIKSLPTYPFDHQRSFWTESRVSGAYRNAARGKPHPVLGMKIVETSTSAGTQWRNILRVKELPWLSGHKLQGQTVFCATGYVVMAIEALRQMVGDAIPTLFEISNLTIGRALAFNDDNTGVETVFSMDAADAAEQDQKSLSVTFSCSSSPSSGQSLAINAQGSAKVYFDARPEVDRISPPAASFDLVDVNTDRFYKALTKLGYDYSVPFHGVESIKRRTDFATGLLADQGGSQWEDDLLVHPGLLDSAMQTIFAAYCSPGDERLWSLHVPTSVGNILINPDFAYSPQSKRRKLLYRASLTDEDVSRVTGDIELLAEDGQSLFVQIEGVILQPFSSATSENDSTIFSNWVYSPAGPDGMLASEGGDLNAYEQKIALELERVSFFYLRRLVQTISQTDANNTLLHYQRLLNWASHVVDQVTAGKNEFVRPEHLTDTHDDIRRIVDQ